MKNNIIPIVFAADNNYVPYMATTMQSIMENADKNKEYLFYVLHKEITNEFITLLNNQISLFPHFSIEFINVGNIINKYNLAISRQHVTVETYFRLLIPELLENHQKVIYLDGDMICCVDISLLFDTNLDNKLVAAVRDTAIGRYYSKGNNKHFQTTQQVLCGLKDPKTYFNAGLLVLNLELFRKTISTDKLFELAESRKWYNHDQDILNFLAEDKTILLPYFWNLMFTPDDIKYLPVSFQNEFNEANSNPNIIHYNNMKPWKQEVLFPHFEAFWKYATRTPFISIIIERMKTEYLILSDSFKRRIPLKLKSKRGDISIYFVLISCVKALLFRNRIFRNIHQNIKSRF